MNWKYNLKVFTVIIIILSFVFFVSGCQKRLKLSLNDKEVTITLGEEIKVDVLDNTIKDIVWESEDSSVATVENGTIKAVGEGTTNILAKAGDSKAKIKVIVQKEKTNNFIVTWRNYNEEVLELDVNVKKGSMPKYNGKTPEREGYQFVGWDPEITEVTKDITYVAQFMQEKVLTTTWKNWDGATLYVNHRTPYDTTPQYLGPTPTREEDDYFTYLFIGWSPALVPIKAHTTYTAQFAAVYKTFTVTWTHPDGTVLEVDEGVIAGTYAEYNSPLPTFSDDPNTGAKRKFYRWLPNPDSIKILADTKFTAQMKEVHTVSWFNEGQLIQSNEVFKGTLPVYEGAEPRKPRDNKYLYTFKDWSPKIVEVNRVDVDYEATYDCFPDPSKEFEFEESITYGGLMITDYKLKDTGEEVIIPEWYNGQKITEIFDCAFEGSLKLKKVVISNNLLSIRPHAFENCELLQTVELGPNIKNIEDDTFNNCISLESIIFKSAIEEIRHNAFYNCDSLTEIVFPEGLKNIYWSAFEDCDKLKRVEFPESLFEIQPLAFANCIDLEIVDFSQIGNLKHIGASAFENCISLDDIQIPGSVEGIGIGAFLSCYNLTKVIFNEGLKSIGDLAFKECELLENLCLPDSLVRIGMNAFEKCDSFDSVIIPKNVNYIGECPFKDCQNIEVIIVDKDNETFDSRDSCNAIIKTATNSLIVACQTTTIPNTVEIIEGYAFYNIPIKKITIPESVKHIRSLAFVYCHSLPHAKVTRDFKGKHSEICRVTMFIPKTVETIGDSAFVFDNLIYNDNSVIYTQFCLHTNATAQEKYISWGLDGDWGPTSYVNCYFHFAD